MRLGLSKIKKANKMKEHKQQILAVLALALALGMVMPSAAFASEGTADEAGIEALAEGSEGANGGEDGAGEKEETLGLADSIAELNKRVQTLDSFATYRKAADKLISNMQGLADFTMKAETAMSKTTSGVDENSLWKALSATTQTAVKDMDCYAALQYIKTQNGEDYTKLKTKIDSLLTLAADEIATIRAEAPKVETGLTLAANLAPADLIKAVQDGIPHYGAYNALYSALVFVREATPASGVVTAENINLAQPDEGKQMLAYNKIAVAALAIDGNVMSGLYNYKLPTTSAPDTKPEAPDTGIVGMIESGALDLGTITLIVSVALASVAGLGLIAKLYLKHKF